MIGKWDEFEFESMIPIEYDKDENIIFHKYTNYKCSICGYKNGNKKSNYCPDCGIKMKVD